MFNTTNMKSKYKKMCKSWLQKEAKMYHKNKKRHKPVNVLTHSNSWKSHSLMDMSAEHEAGIIMKYKQLPSRRCNLYGFRGCLLVKVCLHIKCTFFL